MLPSLDELKLPPFHHEMIFVAGGTFLMGNDEEGAEDRERPVHQVQVGDFCLAKYPVTQALWKAVMGENPALFLGDDLPVEQVSWNDAQAFIQKLNEATGGAYRLPTEAEREYAARGGRLAQGLPYAGGDHVDDVAWYDANSQETTHPVGLKRPNELGLYDLCGNVWEWCQDWYARYAPESQVNPQGPASGTFRTLRGGSWLNPAQDCHSAFRFAWDPEDRNDCLGFRLASAPPQ